MAKTELLMPKMGESIMEATILKWVKKVGDKVEEDETILEIATDKVDSEIPSPVDGVIKEILFNEEDVVEVGKAIAIIETEGEEKSDIPSAAIKIEKQIEEIKEPIEVITPPMVAPQNEPLPQNLKSQKSSSSKFYSPLVKSIAQAENISISELENIEGTGAKGRVTKKDIMAYVKTRGQHAKANQVQTQISANGNATPSSAPISMAGNSGAVEIVEMDRMRKLIADHMVMSKQTSPHVTSFVEADVTNIVDWREANKNTFLEKYGEKITYTPIFIEAVVKAIKDYPMVNVSVEDKKIYVKRDINIGMAAALPSGNLIVPVIKNADYLNLSGLTKSVNDLANRARNNKLKPKEIQDGTFTITNVGTFGNVMGTPIINQPQVAILAVGAIRKKPAVVETKYGDLIAVRKMMFLSLSYDHRVVDGFLGGSFLKKIADYLEAFDENQGI